MVVVKFYGAISVRGGLLNIPAGGKASTIRYTEVLCLDRGNQSHIYRPMEV